MRSINRIIESWRAWRRWSAVDRGSAAGSAEARVDRALRESAPREDSAESTGAMRGRVLSRILNESVDGVSMGTPRAVEVVRDRIGWVIGGCALACLVMIAGVVALRASAPASAPQAPIAGNLTSSPTAPAIVRETDTGVFVMNVPVRRIIGSVAGQPLEDEARRLMSDVKRAATALQERLPRLSFADNGQARTPPGF